MKTANEFDSDWTGMIQLLIHSSDLTISGSLVRGFGLDWIISGAFYATVAALLPPMFHLAEK